jgi:hypothetical protein
MAVLLFGILQKERCTREIGQSCKLSLSGCPTSGDPPLTARGEELKADDKDCGIPEIFSTRF